MHLVYEFNLVWIYQLFEPCLKNHGGGPEIVKNLRNRFLSYFLKYSIMKLLI